jgi:putative tryptophan/tyrosine transport system substrate-binding protein
MGQAISPGEQLPNLPLVGYLGAGLGGPCPVVASFRRGLRDYGYVEGENIAVEYRFSAFYPERYPTFVDELLALGVDVLVAADSQAIPAAQAATKTVPIVMSVCGDPVGEGFVASLERPGGNITGMTNLATALTRRRLELLLAVTPPSAPVAVLWNAGHKGVHGAWRETEEVAAALGIDLLCLGVRGPEDFEDAFAAARREHAGALLVLQDRLTTFHRREIVERALDARLPGMYG